MTAERRRSNAMDSIAGLRFAVLEDIAATPLQWWHIILSSLPCIVYMIAAWCQPSARQNITTRLQTATQSGSLLARLHAEEKDMTPNTQHMNRPRRPPVTQCASTAANVSGIAGSATVSASAPLSESNNSFDDARIEALEESDGDKSFAEGRCTKQNTTCDECGAQITPEERFCCDDCKDSYAYRIERLDDRMRNSGQ